MNNINLEKMSDEEIAVFVFALEHFHDSARKSDDIKWTEKIIDDASNLRMLFVYEYEDRALTFDQFGK